MSGGECDPSRDKAGQSARDDGHSAGGDLGDWVVADVRNEDGARIAAKDASAWLGAKVRLSGKSIRIAPPPKGVHRPSGLGFDVAETCTAPVYDNDIKRSASDLSAYKDMYKYFGLARPSAGRLYMIECHSAEDRDAELTHEDIAGPYLLYTYAPGKIVIAWASVLLLLTGPAAVDGKK